MKESRPEKRNRSRSLVVSVGGSSSRVWFRALALASAAIATAPAHGRAEILVDLLRFAAPQFESVWEFAVAPDGRFAAFVGFRDGEYSVYSVSIPEGHLRQLGPVEPVFQSGLEEVVIVGDATRVLFRQGSQQVWSVLESSPSQNAVDLLDCLPEGLLLYDFDLLGDGRSVLLRVDRGGPSGPRELFVVDVEGCGRRPRRLNHALGAGESVGSVSVSADGAVASYTSSFAGDPGLELWVTEVNDPHPRRVTKAIRQAPGEVYTCKFTPASDRCLFLGDLESAGKLELFSADLSPGTIRVQRISGDLPADVEVVEFEISSIGNWATYMAANSAYWAPVAEVFATPVLGPASEARPLSDGHFSADLSTGLVAVSSDGRSVFLVRYWPSSSEHQLIAVPIDGSVEQSRAVSPRIGGESRLAESRVVPPFDEMLFAVASGGVPEIRCYATAASGIWGEGLPLWTEALFEPSPSVKGPCVPSPTGRGSVSLLASADGPMTQQLLRWSTFDSPPNPKPLLLTPSEAFDDFFGIKEDFEFTRDGGWVLFRGRSPGGPLSLWARRLPLFHDGFESGTTLHWSLSSAEPSS